MRRFFKENILFNLLSLDKRRIFPYTIGLIGNSFSVLVFNYLAAIGIKYLTDGSINRDMEQLLYGIRFMGIGFLIFSVVFSILGYLFDSSVKKITGNIRKRLFSHTLRLPMGYIESKHSGDIISRLTNDVQMAENAYSWQLLMPMMAIVGSIGAGILIFRMNWKMALIIFSLGFATFLVNLLFVKPLKIISDMIQEKLGNLTSSLSDMIAGSYVIRVFHLIDTILKRFFNINYEILGLAMKRNIKQSELSAINTFLEYASFMGIIVISSIMVINKQMTFGTSVAIVQLTNPIFWLFNALGSFITQLQGSLAGARRIIEILEIPTEETGRKGLPEIQVDISGEPVIEFRDVTFWYEEGKPILKDFNLRVYRGQFIAIVGLSGSGKTTIFKLLQRFYSPQEGEIYIFGRPISEYTLEEIRSLIAYVPQESYLFTGTIEENIGYGKIGATKEEIIESARYAYAYDFISQLEDGFNTIVGERGAQLSGGERQRIAIARALLKDAPILLLDEATSSLDSESERQVQQAIEVLMEGRTSLVVAHRLSTIMKADIIYVISDGTIVETGNHRELIDKNGLYRYLYGLQFKS